ncbi:MULTISPECIES: hypothetical protein [Bradyrhizobium]|jgi:hypothetical protein|uniref:hypothetical protein n=1 Tax=Bradyrhizobium elkanii TaxID=29448 RepID=UPI000484F505|nr:hypothetical protein [Bradyrhizobium elkanii]MCS3445781.1 hypothetical protein [Bradyrhizobium elkanii]MCS3563088.1 hypothetical protein [Bradyrhizobium elkanii]MCW2147077.1 hypothetical protein [Bradyrhizobium elkanii]MCW2353848.1 hypothetical protein [Bradyrhizobium elkanii]MCW2379907.1 hypothetical protein [Bradyrhizobium elkanii]
MRSLTVMSMVVVGVLVGMDAAIGQTSCRVCADQQKACMKNYAGPTCESEYQMCKKACKK